MTERVFNFSAGPASLPQSMLEASASALVNYQDSGVGIAEVSHRGPEFLGVLNEARQRCADLLQLDDNYEVLFLQGGATQQFSLIPMNFLKGSADYLVTGQWAKKAFAAGKDFGTVRAVADSSDENYNYIPAVADWDLDENADYLHVCTNNTIFGTRLAEIPEHKCLVADMSSEILSRQIDGKKFGLIYAGAQKNLGPSGVVVVAVRKDLLASAKTDIPAIFSYQQHAEKESCLNTPPTFGIYMLLETFRWIESQGGVAEIEKVNTEKAKALYDAIDGSDGFYTGTVKDVANRSHMNVTFTLPDEDKTKAFIAGAKERGMVALKGYRTVGGIRASIYNAIPLAGCESLAAFMKEFKAAN